MLSIFELKRRNSFPGQLKRIRQTIGVRPLYFFHLFDRSAARHERRPRGHTQPFCPAVGEEDGGDYAEASRLRINSARFYYPVTISRLIEKQRSREVPETSKETGLVCVLIAEGLTSASKSPLVSGKGAQGRESFPSPPFCDNKEPKTGNN